jgi:hypothetical protein
MNANLTLNALIAEALVNALQMLCESDWASNATIKRGDSRRLSATINVQLSN